MRGNWADILLTCARDLSLWQVPEKLPKLDSMSMQYLTVSDQIQWQSILSLTIPHD